eukprot:NODE_14_length_51535_cov_1.125049.p19 type:complete len:334 gc:universal NODE_14_length_51535_cov_1.125049:35388-34387(-)
MLLLQILLCQQLKLDASTYVCSLTGPVNNLVILPKSEISTFGLEKVVSFDDLRIGVVSDENLHMFNQYDHFKDEEVTIANYAKQTSAGWPLMQISNSDTFKYPPQAGAGVDVYIIDTGVSIQNTELEGRATFGLNMFSYDSADKANDDLNGHGTHVAGIVASKTYGVAKKANIIAVKALSRTGNSRWSCVLDALQWVYLTSKGKCNPAVVNMSLSGAKNVAINTVLNDLVTKGLTIVAAAGNSAADSCQYTPASADKIITVGSVSQSRTFSRFSNYGMCLDILAPGEQIASLGPGTTTKNVFKSGTSMASPFVVFLNNLGRSCGCNAFPKPFY